MANLYYVDEDGSLKTIANTDSPSFLGKPTTVSLESHNDRDIMNVEDAIKYIDEKVSEFNQTRIVEGESNSNQLTGLIPNKKYMVTVTGKFNTGTSDTYTLGPVVLRDSSNRILKSSGNAVKNLNNPKCVVSQSATVILTKAPADGKIFGLVNYDFDNSSGTNANYILALRLS